jgi:hypothetical protein
MATIGMAAAHPLLAPVVAVGGLIWVSTPMVILKKSQKQWEAATKKMTDAFWAWAPPSVFVCAIENWSGLEEKPESILELVECDTEEAEADEEAEEDEDYVKEEDYFDEVAPSGDEVVSKKEDTQGLLPGPRDNEEERYETTVEIQ